VDNLYEKTERASLPIFCIRSLRPIWRGCMLLCMLITALIPPVAESRETGDILFHDDFMSLEQWKPLIFPKIKAHTVYSIVGDGDNFYLKAESNASASAIVYKDAFDASQYQKVRWRWKIEHVYKKGNAEEKSGDDYPSADTSRSSTILTTRPLSVKDSPMALPRRSMVNILPIAALTTYGPINRRHTPS